MLSKADHGKGWSQSEEVEVGRVDQSKEEEAEGGRMGQSEKGGRKQQAKRKAASCTQKGRKQREVGGAQVEEGEVQGRGRRKEKGGR